MANRTRSDRPSNTSFEIISQELGDVKKQLKSVTSQMGAMLSTPGISAPTPSIPFKIAESGDRSGIEPTVSIKIPKNTGVVRVQLIRANNNVVKDGETAEEAKERALTQVKVFRIDVNDQQRMAGLCVARIGPIPVSDKEERNRYQLVQLIGKPLDEDQVARNPSSDPYESFPFTVFKVRNDGGSDEANHYFTIGDTTVDGAPSEPALNLIVANAVNLVTQVSDATATFKVFASGADNTKTFADLDITECFIRIKPFAMADDPMGDTDAQTYPAVIDPTKTFALISAVLPLGERYIWTRSVTKNGAGKQVATPMTQVDFYAGGAPATAGIPELEAFTISVTPKNANHSLVTLTIKQFANSMAHPFATLLKRATITVLEPGDNPATIKPQYKEPLLDEEDCFVQGNTFSLTKKVVHKANLASITFKASVFAINHTPAVPIKRDATEATGNSMLNIDVLEPAAMDLVGNAVDGDQSEMRSIATFRLWATPTRAAGGTFADIGVMRAGIYLKRVKTTSNGNDTTDSDTEVTQYTVEIEDRTVKFVDLKVPNLATARKYRWRRTFLASDVGIALSTPGTFVDFVAGTGLVDPTLLVLYAPTFNVIDKNLVEVTCRFDQPATGTPVALKNIDLERKRSTEAEYMRLADKRIILRENPNYSSNTTGDATDTILPNLNQKYVTFQLTHKPKQDVLYRFTIRAIGNIGATSPSASINSGDGAPALTGTTVPSAPSNADIVANEINGDPTAGNARVVLRVFACELRATNVPSLGRPATWDDVNATMVEARIKGSANPQAEPIRINATTNPTDNFTDLEFNLSLGKQYTWTRNVASNGANTPAIGNVTFFAGGGVDLAGLGLVITGTLQLDPRHTEINFTLTQPASPILFKRIVLFKTVVGRNTTPVNEDRIRALDDETLFTAGAKMLTLTTKHPQSSTVNVTITVFGLNGTSKSVSTTLNIGSDGIPPPTDPPSAPALALLSTTTADAAEGTENITTVQVFADPTQTKTFQTVGATTVNAVFQRVGGTGKQTFGGALDDTQVTQTSVIIECSTLRLGKQYAWINNINLNGGGRRASPGNIIFRAGGFGNSANNITFFATQFNNFDDRGTEVTFQFFQNSNALVFLTEAKVFIQQSAVPGDVLHVIERINLANAIDETSGTKYNSAGTKTLKVVIKHKRPPNMVTVKLRLIAQDGSQVESTPAAFNVGADDPGPPIWVESPNEVTIKWKPTVLKGRFRQPDGNMRTHLVNRAALSFAINGQVYVWDWNPDTQGVNFRQRFGGLPANSVFTDVFLIDLGKGSRFIFNEDKPTPGGGAGDLPAPIYNDLQTFGGTMQVDFFIVNQAVGLRVANTGAILTYPF